jgi:hypothetical protein
MDLKAAGRAASQAAAQIDARIKTKLVRRARKHGMTEDEGIELAEALKRAARHTKHLPVSSWRRSPGRLLLF